MKDGEPWFVAKDVADVLEFRDATNAVRYLDDSEKDTLNECTLGGEQSVTRSEKGTHNVSTLGGQQCMTTTRCQPLAGLPARSKGSHTVTTPVRHIDEIGRRVYLAQTAN